MKNLKGFKLNTVFNLILQKVLKDGTAVILPEDFYISSECDIIRNEEDVETFSTGSKIFDKINCCRFKESGISIGGIREHLINVYKYSPLKGGSYIDLPKNVKHNNKGLLNIKNKDDKCFMWCHIAHLFPTASDHKNRLSKYINHENDVDYTGITFPVTLNQIDKIEKLKEINE